MYKIYDSDGSLLGLADEARYVKRSESGSLIVCDQEEAEGVAFNGKFYEGGGAIQTKDALSVDEIRVTLGLDEDTIQDMLDLLAEHSEAITDHEERIAALEDEEETPENTTPTEETPSSNEGE